MKIKNLALAVIAATAMTLTSQAVDLNISESLGLIMTGDPADEISEAGYITDLFSLNNVVGYSPTGSTAGAVTIDGHDYIRFQSSFKNLVLTKDDNFIDKFDIPGAEASLSDRTITGILGSYFVLGKYNGGGGGDFVWYVAGGDVTLPAKSNPYFVNKGGNGKGLSHWSIWSAPSNVPDGGSTVALLGIALAGLGVLRRKISSK